MDVTRREFIRHTALAGGLALAPSLAAPAEAARQRAEGTGAALFAPDNLVAWCIVPFDAKQRGPEERAAMLRRLGFTRFAYDWRAEHLPTFDRELDALTQNGVRLDAFWFPVGMEPERDANAAAILSFLRRRGVKTQLWLSLNVKDEGDQQQRVEAAAKPVRWAAEEAAKLDCRVGLYNHGGWFGEPENQLAVLRRVERPNVGLVYNFHHGRPHMDRFPELFRLMQPHLLTLNINGMQKDAPQILGVGRGDRDLEMLRVVAESGWRGPIGLLGHRAEIDAEVALRENLDGLRSLLPKLRRAA